MVGGVLTAAEVQELTGCRQRKACIRQLARQKVPFVIAADGWPRVEKASLLPKPIRWGLVYVVEDSTARALKIGFTMGDPRLRLKALQTGNPTRLRFRDLMPANSAVERRLHRDLQEYRLTGEWFRDVLPVRRRIAAQPALALRCAI